MAAGASVEEASAGGVASAAVVVFLEVFSGLVLVGGCVGLVLVVGLGVCVGVVVGVGVGVGVVVAIVKHSQPRAYGIRACADTQYQLHTWTRSAEWVESDVPVHVWVYTLFPSLLRCKEQALPFFTQ